MFIEYKTVKAKIHFCSKTKSYYGEIFLRDICLMFQATNRRNAILAMQKSVDMYLDCRSSNFKD